MVAGKLVRSGQDIVAAGFVQTIAAGGIVCTGRRGSLEADSRPERDTAVITRGLAGT